MRNQSPARSRRTISAAFHTAPAVVAWVLTRPRSGPSWRAVNRQDYLASAGSVPAGSNEAALPAGAEMFVEGGSSAAASAS